MIGSYIKDVRKCHSKMTLMKLEEKTGFSNGYLSMIENGHKGTPPADTLRKIEEGLNSSYIEMLIVAEYLTENDIKEYIDNQASYN